MPPAEVLDTLARTVRARDYSFANCLWLTTGALLHIIGIPVGATALEGMPPYLTLPPDLPRAMRESLSWQYVLAMGDDANRRAVYASLAHPGVPRHSFLRHFLGELPEPVQSTTSAAEGDMQVDAAPCDAWWRDIDGAVLAAMKEAGRVVSVADGCSPSDMAELRNGSATAPYARVLADAGRGGWGSLSPYDVGHILLHGGMVSTRAASQNVRMLSTSLDSKPLLSKLYSAIVLHAYTEMSIACRLLQRRHAAAAAGVRDASTPVLFLNSGANPFEDSLGVRGAVTIFPPVAELRRLVASSYEANFATAATALYKAHLAATAAAAAAAPASDDSNSGASAQPSAAHRASETSGIM
ncbi:hypothetical protein EON68_04270, partial [archaeon]